MKTETKTDVARDWQIFREANSGGQWSEWRLNTPGKNLPAHDYRECAHVRRVDSLVDSSIRELHEQLTKQNNTLRTRLEAVEKDLEEQRIVNKELNKPIQDVCLAGRHGMKSYVELEDELTKAEKANGELVSRIEQALAHLVEAGSNKKHDPSWIRPMTMTRKEVNDACIQAYHQLQTCLATAEVKGEG